VRSLLSPLHSAFCILRSNVTLTRAGIRREDKNNWERRVPLTPEHVAQLVSLGLKVLIQPSNIRIFPNEAYAKAGAVVSEDLSPASVVLAVKEVPIALLLPLKTYLFFSHTIKAQPANMPLLDAILEKQIRMIDYECITQGGIRGEKRLVAFGRYAGLAGGIDLFTNIGERLLSMGYSSPFLAVASTVRYPSIAAALDAVAVCGREIAEFGLPEDICPLTIVVTGALQGATNFTGTCIVCNVLCCMQGMAMCQRAPRKCYNVCP
jgi:alpha-aminoadipic semialdehyde synthase